MLRTKAYRVGQAGVKSLEYSSRNGFVIVTGTKATVEVPVAWLRLGEPVAEVKPDPVVEANTKALEQLPHRPVTYEANPKRGKR